MQATAVVYVALLLMVGRCTADDPEASDDSVEDSGVALGAAEAVGAELVKESRLGPKASQRSRFPAGMIGYNRYYPEYSPEYYYPPVYPRYYPSYSNNYYPTYPTYPTVNYPPVNYPTNNYPTNNYYPTGYPPYYPYEYVPYGAGVNEYSAKHERA